jgi:hypothetical protein
MKNKNLWILAATAILIGYYVWNFYVGSRYQALCNLDYWRATPAQIDACKDMKSELENQK